MVGRERKMGDYHDEMDLGDNDAMQYDHHDVDMGDLSWDGEHDESSTSSSSGDSARDESQSPRRRIVTNPLNWHLDPRLWQLQWSSNPRDVMRFRGFVESDFNFYMMHHRDVAALLNLREVYQDATPERMDEFLREINDYVDDYHSGEERFSAIDTTYVWFLYCCIVVYNRMYAILTDQELRGGNGRIIVPYASLPDSDNEQYE